ncbi:hypothetical protein XU18_0985 [Perkinsela sp. CCAP 1560/4]|nr:hypothetical protein XU18_2304 [Perkinsela sp. CCAP 1560/4]KNH08416.1 hypothetical protein XU18_0985 [Perkinsela sp. CCAP 1560/4]|eukprot:KNH06946.1 hypothetical protein XU18_2304 [Perkinsela sp. CCAP 1560/4]
MSTESKSEAAALPNLIKLSSQSELSIEFPERLRQAVQDAYTKAVSDQMVPPWRMISYINTFSLPSAAGNQAMNMSDVSSIEASSPLRTSTAFVLEQARAHIDSVKSSTMEKRMTMLSFSFFKDLLGGVILLGLASTPEEHDFLGNQCRIVMSTAKKNPLKADSEAYMFSEQVRKYGAPCRPNFAYLFCFLPIEYLLRFVSMLPRLMSHYAGLYQGYVLGSVSHLAVVVNLLLRYIDENVELTPLDEYCRIPSDDSI